MFFIYYFGTGLVLTLPCAVLLVKYRETRQEQPWMLMFMTTMTVVFWWLIVPYVVYLWFHHTDAYNPVCKMCWAPGYQGYWLVDREGNKHAFGSAIHHPFKERMVHSYKPDELTVNPSGRILCADGTAYLGDVYEQDLLAPIVGVLANYERDGYYIYTQAGEVFAFGKAVNYGSLAEVDPTQYGISWKGYMKERQQQEAALQPTQAGPAATTVTPAPA